MAVAVVALSTGFLFPPVWVGAAAPGLNGGFAFSLMIRGEEPGEVVREIHTVRADGGDLQRLTWDAVNRSEGRWWIERSYLNPVWSPDGRSIAYEVHLVDGSSGPGGYVEIMDGDGTSGAAVYGGAGFGLGAIDWSPSGDRLVFTSSGSLVIVSSSSEAQPDPGTGEPGGTDAVRIRESPIALGGVSWSPRGDLIAFSEQLSTTEWALRVIEPDGTGLSTLVVAPRIGAVDWSSDGNAIAYEQMQSAEGSDSSPDQGEVAWIDIGTGDQHEVEAPEGLDVWNPMWSPDGNLLAFLVGDLNGTVPNRTIWAINPADGSAQHLTGLPDLATDVDWQSIPIVEPIGLVDPDTSQWHLAQSDDGLISFYYGNPGDYPFMGDWDCDTVATSGLFRQSDAYAYLRNSNSQGVADIRFFFGNPSDVPLAGDFNGDGCDTLSIYRPSEARFYIINKLGENEGGLGAAEYSFLFGNPGDKPVVGDWDGDGIDEIGLHREASGFFYYRNTLSTGIADGQFYFGDPGDRFVSGDWGVVDGVDTPAVFRPFNSTFYFRHTLTQGIADSQFIWTGAGMNWLPVAGNFNLN